MAFKMSEVQTVFKTPLSGDVAGHLLKPELAGKVEENVNEFLLAWKAGEFEAHPGFVFSVCALVHRGLRKRLGFGNLWIQDSRLPFADL